MGDHGERIRRARMSKGIDQGEMARRMGISQAFLSRIESGKRGCSAEILQRAAQALGLSLDQLMGLENPIWEALQALQQDPEAAIYLRSLRGHGCLTEDEISVIKEHLRSALHQLAKAREPGKGEI